MSVRITQKAKEMIINQLKDKKQENIFLRISVQGFGWGGPTFGIALEGSKDENKDYYKEIDGIKVIVEKDLVEQFNGFDIDYATGWFNKGFRIIPGTGGASC